ncbi:hypothetical protein VVD49_09170 [Uliginosibacterium sp. H3]|uniref:PQ-loop repeat-containing protein n=1 Tax=Uliginosibacterium silvisoli TaxID=3114758 RepID=A0ABU6K2N5_9RHOO|nr:hypothetical protein [Uliginosibacterium sp. H3]
MSIHEIYVFVLQWAFAILSYLRICAYVPTCRRLMRPGARGDDYSLQTWMIWAFSHLAFVLMLLEQGNYEINAMLVVSILNMLLCFVTAFLIARLRLPRHEPGDAKRERLAGRGAALRP